MVSSVGLYTLKARNAYVGRERAVTLETVLQEYRKELEMLRQRSVAYDIADTRLRLVAIPQVDDNVVHEMGTDPRKVYHDGDPMPLQMICRANAG